MRKLHIFTACAVILGCCLCSCNEYGDDIQGIGKRVVVLEDSVLRVQNTLETLAKLQKAMATYGVVKNIVSNKDGSTTLEFLDGREPITFVNGENGKPAEMLLEVARDDSDGHYYWKFNGEWLTDEDGNRLSAEPKDGKDGKDGVDGKDGKDGTDAEPSDGEIILPQARINPDTRFWEISVDGGQTWKSTGVYADGRDGKDGRDGRDGKNGTDGKDGKDGTDGSEDPIIINATYTDRFIILTIRIGNETKTVYLSRVY